MVPRAGHRHRQRVPRCPADPPARLPRWRLARARDRLRRLRRAALRTWASSRRMAGMRRRPTGSDLELRPAKTSCLPRSPRAGAPRRALHRLRSRRGRRSATRCRPCAGMPMSIRLPRPGCADLTAHVQFAALAEKARAPAFAADGPMTQAEFLGALGMAERTARLMAANPGRAGEIEAAVQRLMSPTGMGACSRRWPCARRTFRRPRLRLGHGHAHAPHRPQPCRPSRHPARLLHAPWRRVAGHLRQPQLRARLQGRSRLRSRRTARASWRISAG